MCACDIALGLLELRHLLQSSTKDTWAASPLIAQLGRQSNNWSHLKFRFLGLRVSSAAVECEKGLLVQGFKLKCFILFLGSFC